MTGSHGAPTPTDPSAIDLEAIQARRKPTTEYHGDLTYVDVDALIAAVEALRERVAAQENEMDSLLECWAHIHVQLEKFTGRKFDETELPRTVGGVLEVFENMEVRAKTAEARVVELAGALAFYRADDERAVMGGVLESVCDRPATATLAATPAEALERARAVSNFGTLTKLLLTRGHLRLIPPSSGSGRKSIKEWREALAELDALGKEEGHG